MKITKGICLVFLLLTCVISGQSYFFHYDFHHYYRNTYTPVETALGGMTSVFDPSPYGHTINPVLLLNGETQIDFTYRYNKQYSLAKEKYRTASVNYVSESFGAFGFSYVAYHPDLFSIYMPAYNNLEILTTRLTRDYYSFSYALHLAPNISAGVSLNYISDYVYYDKKIDYQSFDLALMYSRDFQLLPEFDSRVILSFVLDNIYRMGEYQFTRGEYYDEETALPQVFLLSAAKQFDFKYRYADKNLLAINLQAGYTDGLDENYYTLITLGFEIKFLEYVTLRFANSQAPEESRRLNVYNFGVKNSFGFGIEVPLKDIINTGLALDFKLDYGHSSTIYRTYENGIYGLGNNDQNAFSFGIELSKF